MRVLRVGLRGDDVREWQLFLHANGADPGEPDGDFGPKTLHATKDFQDENGLKADGIVGPATYARAFAHGFDPLDKQTDVPNDDPYWPPKPVGLKPLVTNSERAAVFGHYDFKADPQPGNPENLEILGDWESKNIVKVHLPQLAHVQGAPGSCDIRFHRVGADELVALWAAWEKAGLTAKVLTWGGSFVPRFVRGSHSLLSNHAFGSAFDINVAWNQRKKIPALVGAKGCVRELVGLANDHGFYWGGHFSTPDGMHFEIAHR